MTRSGYTIAILASSVLASACTDETDPVNTPPSGATSGDQETTYDHDNSGISPWELLERLQQEGPPTFTSRIHSCSKMRYQTIGTVLGQLGVNVTSTTALSAGQLYTSGFNALGGPNYANRIRENISISTSGASRLFDVFAAAAPEVIASISAGTNTRCPSVQLFDASNNCRPEGITCLIGQPATTRHLDYCNLTVATASSVDVGKRLAVAALLAASYTCE